MWWKGLSNYFSTIRNQDLSTLSLERAGFLLLSLIESSFVELSEDLLEARQDLSRHVMESHDLLYRLILHADIQVLEAMLDIGKICVDSPYDHKIWSTALCTAIKARKADIVRLFLSRGAPVNFSEHYNDPPPIFCCVADKRGKCLSSEDTLKFLTLLLDHGADVNARFNKTKLIQLACESGNHTAVSILIDHHVELRDQMLLNITSKRGDATLLRTLLDAGLDSEINKPYAEHFYNHSFNIAIKLQGAMELLFGTVVSRYGTALHTAIQSNQPEVVEILLKRSDCNLDIQIHGKLSYAIIMACFMGSERTLEILFAERPRIDVNVVGELGSALAVFCAIGDTIIVQKLIQKGAKITESRGNLGSPLVVACLQGYDDIVEALMRKDSTNKDSVGIDGLTPLCAAIKSSSLKIVQRLIEKKVDVNLASSSGTTPLLLAVSTEPTDLEIVTALLEAKADTNKRGGKEAGHLSPLEMCREKGNELLVEALKRAGAKDTATPSAELLQWRKSQADGSETD